VRIIGVEPVDSDAMTRSIAAGHRVVLEHVGRFADGVAVRQVGEHTFELCRRYLDETLTVTTDEICAAIKDAFEETRTILEPSGAVALAGLKRAAERGTLAPGAAVVIMSGANMNFTRLGYVTERAEIGEHREAILAVTIPERPGAFLEFCRTIGERSVTEFNYRLASRAEAHIFVGLEVSGRAEAGAIGATLTARGYTCTDLGADDLAKTHVRHMVGGRSPAVSDEVLYSFEFPERPGALMQFLTSLGSRWNISLFHYRNHGAAFGRVLCGFEVPPSQRADLGAALVTLGFSCSDETDNAAARLFLR
jgi:threonine dehydratase